MVLHYHVRVGLDDDFQKNERDPDLDPDLAVLLPLRSRSCFAVTFTRNNNQRRNDFRDLLLDGRFDRDQHNLSTTICSYKITFI